MVTALALGGVALTCGPPPPATVRLLFTAAVGDEPLMFDEPVYANPGGEGVFAVRDFLMYVSNVQLIGEAGTWSAPDSYHLVRFDNESKSYEIVLEDAPRDTYSRLILSIGVDEEANSSLASVGDLDPNGRMAWNWETGYKFVLFEGALMVDGERRPLVYHVGFSENRKVVELDLAEPAQLFSPDGLVLQVDLLELFTGEQVVDMQELSNVKFDRTDARLLANNYASMISIPSE